MRGTDRVTRGKGRRILANLNRPNLSFWNGHRGIFPAPVLAEEFSGHFRDGVNLGEPGT